MIPNLRLYHMKDKKIYDVHELSKFTNGNHRAGITRTCCHVWLSGEHQEAFLMIGSGVLDINKKEIFEGDIVAEHVNNLKWIYEIKTIDGFGNNLYKVTRYRNFKTEDDNEILGDFYVNEGRSEIRGTEEIIGNIYEDII